MKIRMRKRGKKFSEAPCKCCDIIHLKDEILDKQALKEILQELDGEDVLTGSDYRL